MKTKSKNRTLFFLLSLLIIHIALYISNATIRYVSKTGSSTPPYTTWETAADSIQECINICEFGDTIFVANGVYKEQVVMIPGLSLIGAGMDSCVIDTRDLVTTFGFVSVHVSDSCLFRGFNIKVYYESDMGYGIVCEGSSFVSYNKITKGGIGTYPGLKPTINYNVYENVSQGLWLFNSNAIVRKNIIYIDPNSQAAIRTGIDIEAFDSNYKPIIDSNIIYSVDTGIRKSFGSNPTISNNIIYAPAGISLSISDSAKVYNNLIYSAEDGWQGFYNSGVQNLIFNNNYVTGKYIDNGNAWAVTFGFPENSAKNNVVVNSRRGVRAGGEFDYKYNNIWNNDINYEGFTPDSTNLSVDPMVVNDDTTKGELDFRLQKFSPLIDAGDPNILDRDGSRSDIGLYGGPYGWTYTYQDLAPRPPLNVTAVIEDGFIKITWNKNTEADFSHYVIYRDTITGFIYDTTKIVGVTSDTVFYDNLPVSNTPKKYYYLLTAYDNQNNQSAPSEEINVIITGLTEHPPIGFDGYRLLSNYPNPFNPSTVIPYRLKEAGYVKLYVYDIKGELVRVLVNQWQEKGFHEVEFNPTKEERSRANLFEIPVGKTYSDIATGVYIYHIMVKSDRNIPVFSDMGKMILLK